MEETRASAQIMKEIFATGFWEIIFHKTDRFFLTEWLFKTK